MGNILKLNTVFKDTVEEITIVGAPSIVRLNTAYNLNDGDFSAYAPGFVKFSSMKAAKFKVKSPFYMFSYLIFNGDITDPLTSDNFVEQVYLDGGNPPQHQNQWIEVAADQGQFIVPYAINYPQEEISDDLTLDDVVEIY